MSPETQAYRAGVGAGLGALRRMRQPLVAIDPARGILTRNEAAMRLLAEGDLLRERDGALAATDPPSDVALTLALRELRLAEPNPAVADRRALRLGRATTGDRVAALLVALRPDGGHGAAEAVAVLAVFEPHAGRPADPARLASAFDLTPAESRVAAWLAGGFAPKEVARELGVAPSTVRTQVKRIFEKTGAHRQADLVRLLLLADEI